MTMCIALLLLLPLPSLSAFSHDVVNINIDCGSSSTYTDEIGRTWVADADYTQSGNSMKVSNSSPSDPVKNTLRVFSTGKKSCYFIPSVSEQKVIVRASFYYGNYDNKSSPPTFELLLQGTHWATVETSSDKTVRSEAIYVVKGSSVDVCVSQTLPSLDPFMSALEIRSMRTDIYKYIDPNTQVSTVSDMSSLLPSRKILLTTPEYDWNPPTSDYYNYYPPPSGTPRAVKAFTTAAKILNMVSSNRRIIVGTAIGIGAIVCAIIACFRCGGRDEESAATAATSDEGQGNAQGKEEFVVQMAAKSSYKDDAVLLANDQLAIRVHDEQK